MTYTFPFTDDVTAQSKRFCFIPWSFHGSDSFPFVVVFFTHSSFLALICVKNRSIYIMYRVYGYWTIRLCYYPTKDKIGRVCKDRTPTISSSSSSSSSSSF